MQAHEKSCTFKRESDAEHHLYAAQSRYFRSKSRRRCLMAGCKNVDFRLGNALLCGLPFGENRAGWYPVTRISRQRFEQGKQDR